MEGDGPPPVRDQIRALPATDKDCVLPCVRPVRTYKSNSSTVISKEGKQLYLKAHNKLNTHIRLLFAFSYWK